MKKKLPLMFLLALIFVSTVLSARVFYLSPSGNDNNPGTLASPWFNLNRAWSAIAAGDTVYLRGGTYNYTVQQSLTGRSGNATAMIKIWNYPGESPNITQGSGYSSGGQDLIYFDGNYIHLKGLEISNANRTSADWAAFRSEACNNCIFELINYHHNQLGFTIRNCNNNLVLNCDFHHNEDRAGDNADGINITYITNGAFSNTVRGSRAWNNSDDGFDFWANESYVLIENSWAWRNGYGQDGVTVRGDGSGFKFGQYTTSPTSTLKRTARNCVAYDNRLWGFNENNCQTRIDLFNNIAYNNGSKSYWFGDWGNHVMNVRNNVHYVASGGYTFSGGSVSSDHNSWEIASVTNTDFQNLTNQLGNSRQSDGSLPVITFLNLATGSDMINVGMNVGLPYTGTAPDLGAFETGGAAPPPNQSPVANAGANQTITLPTNTVTLTGNGTDADGTIAAYQWTKISGPTQFTIVSPTQAQTVINNLAQGVYQFELRVTDNLGAIGRDTVQVTVNSGGNQSPTANAGSNQTITLPTNAITLTGSGTDPDGTIASYQWTKIAGPAQFTIVSATQAQTAVNNLVQGVYQFELRVTDNLGALDRDTVQVTVNAAPNQTPTANAGANLTITLPVNTVTLTGIGTDADGTIASYQWTKIAGPVQFTIVSAAQAQTAVNNLVQGVYRFELRVTDNLGAIGRDTVQVTVNPGANQSPTANAGSNQTITLPTNTVTLSGSGIDADGNIASYLWTKIAGPAQFTIVSPAQAQTAVNNLVPGVYQFELRVTDNQGAIGRDTVSVTVNASPNQAPTANAGSNQTITLPANSVTLTGSGSDADGTIASYQWTKIAGPAQFTIVSPTQASTAVNNLVQGVYQFELRVTDNLGAIGRDTVNITVNAAPNQPPTASAGSNQTITLPANSVTLTGSGSDADGTIASYLWTKIAGPAQFTIVSPAQAQTAVNNLIQGVYQFELRVTDNLGAIDRDTVNVTVNAAPNQPPIANSGTNQTISLPANTITLTGSGTDADGTIASYLWTKVAGPTQFTIVSPALAQTAVNNLVQGVYQFELRVTDNQGATDRDTVRITVNAAPPANQPPIASAGPNQTITLPTNVAGLTGSGTDADGSIVSYQWTKVAGPAQFTIVSPTQASTIINNLVQGVYEFELRVTDNLGATDNDTVRITVNALTNQPPAVNAGANQTITLPTNTVTLSGIGIDIDGTITSYQWIKIAGPAQFTIVSPTQTSTAVNNLVQGIYQFELRVTDNLGAIGRDTVQVNVNTASNQPPAVNAGANQTITLPTNTVSLSGVALDIDGSITSYQWIKIAGPAQFTIISPTQTSTIVNNLVQGLYQFELRVTDNLGAIGRDTVLVTVNAPANQPPAVNAGPNQTITLPTNSVTLSGIGLDIDGSITAYQWTKVAGPTQFTIVSSAQSQTAVNNLVQGVYRFELRVTDNLGAFGRDTLQVTVNAAPPNQPPTANAGANQTITLPVNSVTAVGSGADADGSVASYQWTKIAGPAQFAILFPTQTQTIINNLVQGVYQFELRVTDNLGATGRDTMLVTVNAAPTVNQAPVADAGPDQSVLLPVNSVTQNGGGVDPDGSIASYLWRKLTGPAQFAIVSPAQGQTVINNLVQGVYQFELRVTDNTGMFDRDTMQITVYAPQGPAANAGPNQIILFPANTGLLTGSGTPNTGQSIVSYQWSKIAGPALYTIVSPNQAQTEFTNLELGIYQFELTVTDNLGLTGKDTVAIEIQDQLTLIKLYPNPAIDFINVSISSSNYSGPSRITIYNPEGKSVYQVQLERNQAVTVKNIDVTRFANGLYILEVIIDSKTKKTIKFIKQ